MQVDTRLLKVSYARKPKYRRTGRAPNPATDGRVTHHMANTKEYRAYYSARSRCLQPNIKSYPFYGGRGIKFRFKSFEEFFDDIGFAPTPEHTLDRINTNGHYEPGNVRWATLQEQNENHGICHKITIGGVTKTMTAWCRHFGINRSAVRSRIRRGWDEVSAITTPSGAP
jgi:hypothetical protein